MKTQSIRDLAFKRKLKKMRRKSKQPNNKAEVEELEEENKINNADEEKVEIGAEKLSTAIKSERKVKQEEAEENEAQSSKMDGPAEENDERRKGLKKGMVDIRRMQNTRRNLEPQRLKNILGFIREVLHTCGFSMT